MDKIVILEYDRRNMREIEKYVEENDLQLILLNPSSILSKLIDKKPTILLNKDYLYDITPILISYEGKSDLWSTEIISLLNHISVESNIELKYIVDRRYSNDIMEILYHYIDRVDVLETKMGIKNNNIFNIVDLTTEKFKELQINFNNKLFGNPHFKRRLFEEFEKFRLFNKIGEQKIFSVFICGKSGVGKTETARILHNFLSSDEKFIKVNLGNYGDKNALSSLIGSPRGYIGSSKGELSDKILKSKAKIILIDEFEKAGNQVHNFFLELLEDGKFTDSLGREFNLNKYIIVFTSNIKEDKIAEKLPPELQSRFSLMYRFSPISSDNKKEYIEYKSNKLLEKLKTDLDIVYDDKDIKLIKDIDVNKYDNLRKLNREIMLRISNIYQSKYMDS